MEYRDETSALMAQLWRNRKKPNIIVWLRSLPRIATMIPIAKALQAAGYPVHLVFALNLPVDKAAVFGPHGVPAYRVPAARVKYLPFVAIAISSEQNILDMPPTARRVALHHSLPDGNLRRDYLLIAARKAAYLSQADYYCLPAVQTAQDWDVARYAHLFDRTFPRHVLKDRSPHLRIVPFGYPKVDALMAEPEPEDGALDTILYAPTQSTLSFGRAHQDGTEILEALVEGFPEYRITFRPYPGLDADRLKRMYGGLMRAGRIHLDRSPTGAEELRRSAVVVSDRSSVAMSFGLGYARPIILCRAKPDDMPGRRFHMFNPLGYRVSHTRDVVDGVRKVMEETPEIARRIRNRRKNFIYNPGGCTDYLLDLIPDILADRNRPDLLNVPRRPADPAELARGSAFVERMLERWREAAGDIGVLDEDAIRTAYTGASIGGPTTLAGRIAMSATRDLGRYRFPPTDR
ncbi:MAG: hypothetical protein ACU0CI_08795 [Shimia sp.]